MTRRPWLALVLILLLLTVGAAWYWTQSREAPEAPAPLAPPSTDPQSADADAAPEIAYPIEASPTPGEAAGTAATAPLPALSDSDAPVRDALSGAFGAPPIEAYLIPDRLIRRIVATIDTLDGDAPALKQRPVRAVPGRPVVERADGTLVLLAANADRYDAYVSALEAMDAALLAQAYRRYYPLFQQAYVELGYPDRYFNDRVVQIIDHLLATPSVAPPIALEQPKSLYQFADPRLEALSWGRKILIRIGQSHAETVKTKLRALRAEITAAAPSDNG